MSRVHEILRGDKDQPIRKQWHIKIHDGTIYGPVDLPVLCEWASQSRIVPGNLISDNRSDWMPAQDLPELKMEWNAILPNGESYGPFNVLAVPHLVQSGILHPESKLTNRHSGKTLNIKDLIKSASDLPQAHTYNAPNEQDRRAQAEQQFNSRTPLLSDAEIQRTIDMANYRPPGPFEIKPPDETELKTTTKVTTAESSANVDMLKNELTRLNKETERLRNSMAIAERELEAKEKKKEDLTRQAAVREEQLKNQIDQTEKELRLTREELSSLRQKNSEDTKGIEAITKQATKKEQDLNRALEEIRRKAEADASLLFKTKGQIDELKSQKAELQNRSSQEETRLKTQTAELEKQIQSLNAEIQNSKNQYHSLEKDLLTRQEKLQAQTGTLKEKADTATAELERIKRELEVQKKKDELIKQAATREEQLKKQIEQAEKDLSITREELSLIKQKNIEDAKNIEAITKQATKKEQDLNRALEEIRRKAEADSSMLFKTKSQIEELKSQKAELQNRTSQEEARLKTQTTELEKQIQSLNAEIQNSKKQYHSLEKDLLTKQEKLQTQTGTLKEKADTATAEVEKIRKELDARKTLNVDIEKNYSEKETALNLEIRTAKAAQAKTNTELADLRKQFETVKQQGNNREAELQSRIEQLSNESRSLTTTVDNLKKESAAQTEEYRKLEKRSKNFETEIDKVLGTARQQKEERSALDAKSKKLTEELLRYKSDMETERSLHADLKNKFLDEKSQLSTKIEQLQTEYRSSTLKIQEYEKQLTLQKQENEKLQVAISSKDNKHASLNEELKNELQTAKDELATTKQRHLEEKRNAELAQKEARSRELDLRRQIDDKTSNAEATALNLEETKQELGKALLRISDMKDNQKKLEADLTLSINEKSETSAALKKTITQLKSDLNRQKDHYETIIEGERQRGMHLESTTSELGVKLHSEASLLEETIRKLAETEDLLAREKTRFEDERSAFEEKLSLNMKEAAKATSQTEALNKRLKNLENELISKGSLIQENRKELETERSLRKGGLIKVCILEDKLITGESQIAETNRLLTESRTLLKQEQDQLNLQKAELEQKMTFLLQEKAQADSASEALAGKIHNLENKLAATESQLSEAILQLESERSQRLSLSSSKPEKDIEAQKKVDELLLRLEQQANEAAQQKKLLESTRTESSSFAGELGKKIKDIEKEYIARIKQNEADLHAEQEKNKSLTKDLTQSQARQKELEISLTTARAETLKAENHIFFTKSGVATTIREIRTKADGQERSPEPQTGLIFQPNRYSFAVIISALFVISILLIGIFIAGRRNGRSKALAQAQIRQEVAVQAAIAGNTAKLHEKTPEPLPRISVDRAITSYSKTSCTIVFDYGLFSTRTNLMSDAVDTLGAVASQLRDSLKDYKLIIEGHSDTLKTSNTTTAEDNYALGTARANKVMEIFKNKFNLPEDSMLATSTGEDEPPFPNTDDNLRKKNRTVVLKLVPR